MVLKGNQPFACIAGNFTNEMDKCWFPKTRRLEGPRKELGPPVEVRIRVPFFSIVYFNGTLPKRMGRRALLGDINKTRSITCRDPRDVPQALDVHNDLLSTRGLQQKSWAQPHRGPFVANQGTTR